MKKNHLILLIVFILLLIVISLAVQKVADPLPSWNAGKNKQAILDFVHAAIDSRSPKFIPAEERVAVFDQDGTLWVEQPMYTQVIFSFDRIVSLAAKHPEWKNEEPFKSIITKNQNAIAKFNLKDLEKVVAVTHSGMTVEQFHEIVKNWMATAKNKRWNRPYTQLIYRPMLEVMQLLRAKGFKTYIVTGGGQEFVRVYANQVYGVMPDEVIGSALNTQYTYDNNGRAVLMKIPKLLLYNDLSGKPEDIYLFVGRHPRIAFGNSTGDQQMLEYTQASRGAHLMLLVHHDDAIREYAYGLNSKIGTFSDALMKEAHERGWNVISMKNDWNRIF